jgi:hypothetical protein
MIHNAVLLFVHSQDRETQRQREIESVYVYACDVYDSCFLWSLAD